MPVLDVVISPKPVTTFYNRSDYVLAFGYFRSTRVRWDLNQKGSGSDGI